jgi:hypothetical protein
MLPEIKPGKPGMLAVTKMLVQTLGPEVMRPVWLTVTHWGVELAQVT